MFLLSADDDVDHIRGMKERDHCQELYLRACAKFNVSPAAHFIKALKTERVNLNHRQIGAPGVKALCVALVVSTVNNNTKMSSFKSSENIQKKEGGPGRSVSDNQSSSVTLNELAMKARKDTVISSFSKEVIH